MTQLQFKTMTSHENANIAAEDENSQDPALGTVRVPGCFDIDYLNVASLLRKWNL
jgi:hypothetical protein